MYPTSTVFRFLALVWSKSAVVTAMFGLLLPLNGQAQEASLVEGRVVSQSSGLPVAGATVVLVGTLHGTVSDSAGTFRLGPVPNGLYQLRVTAPGFGDTQLSFAVPSSPTIVRVTAARGRLPENPLFTVSSASVPYDGSASTLSSDTRRGLTRVPSVALAAYGTALSYPIVRGLAAGRTGAYTGIAPAVVLDIPSAGRIDVAMIGQSENQGFVLYNNPGNAINAHEAAVVHQDEFTGLDGPAALRIDTGFQTNLRAATAAGAYTGNSSRVAFRLDGRYARGGDYASADGRVMPSSFTAYGVNAAAIVRLSAPSRLYLAASFAGASLVELPGSRLTISSARYGKAAARWEWTPEGSRLRRLSAFAAWAGSDADLRRADSIGLDPPGADPPRAEAMATALQLAVLADLALLRREFVQMGISLRRTLHDGRLVDTAFPEVVAFWPDAVTHDAQFTLATRFSGFRTSAAVLGRVGYRLIRGNTNSNDEPLLRFPVGSLSLAYEYHPRIAWTLGAAAELLRRPPSVQELLSGPVPDIDRVVVGRISGNDGLGPENWMRLSASAQRTAGGTTIEIKSFVAFVGDFIGYTRVDEVGPVADTTRWTYSNRSARFLGLELYARRQLAPFVSVSGHMNYVDAVDLDRGETLPLVSPVGGRADFTAATPGERLLLEFSSEFALGRNNVALALGETAAKGFAIFHMRLGVPLSEHLSFRFGVYNIFNGTFAPLLNPTRSDRRRVPMPGRAWSFALRFQS